MNEQIIESAGNALAEAASEAMPIVKPIMNKKVMAIGFGIAAGVIGGLLINNFILKPKKASKNAEVVSTGEDVEVKETELEDED